MTLIRGALISIAACCVFGCTNSESTTPPEEPTGTVSAPMQGEAGPKKLALLIGIDDYVRVSDLDGCVNDIENMASLLVDKFDFPASNIETLRNEEATRQGIIDALERLVERTAPDDIVVLHYSGHGSQMKDASGDESDGLDETLVPHDARTPNVFDIPDDSINGLLALLTDKTDNVTFIFDSCHSGTGTRSAGKARKVPPDDRDPPPADSFAASTRGTEEVGEWRARDASYVLLSGSRSNQLSHEYRKDGESHGAFTYFLTQEIRNTHGQTTYRDVMDKVVGKVSGNFPTQEPQMEGTAADNFVFSDETSLAQAHVRVSPSGAGQVSVEAGQVQGLTVGSRYDVYPPGTKQFEPPAVAIAKFELTDVDAFSAKGKILSGGPVESASRALEVAHLNPDQKLLLHYVGLDRSDTLSQIKAKLDEQPTVEALPTAEGYNLLLEEIDGAIVTEGGDGSEISPRVSVNDADAVGHVVDQVEHWARWYRVLAIRSTASVPRIKLSIRPVGGTASETDARFGVGEQFEIVVENLSSQDLYLSVLDLSSDGSVSLVYPTAVGATEILQGRGEWIKRLRTTLPDDRDSVRDVVKVFASVEPADMSYLTQGRTRGFVDDEDVQEWETAERVIFVERNPSPTPSE